MKRIVIFIIMFAGLVAAAFAATPQQQLSAAAKKLSDAASVSATFTMKTNGGRGGQVRGSMQMARKACTVSAGGMTMWYDGTTQWVYSVASQEVTVTRPELADLLESNPFVLISGYASHFNVSAGDGPCAVLTPKNKMSSGIESAKIWFDAAGWPSRIYVRFQSDSTIDVTVDKISVGKAMPASAFRFDAAKYPEADIIDLR
ncbi:MAG: outer-membrane lipoprotein carrier protein LolA [Muribaculaceae bacterium]|nr:outer-membrane lipoprotein carrier protein LolA [Muribaculaceae bacterium]